MFSFNLRITISLVILFLFSTVLPAQNDSVFIRINQLGFLPDGYKSATILSSHPINTNFKIKRTSDNNVVFESEAIRINDTLNEFIHNYRALFSEFKSEGEFYLEFTGRKSYSFEIREDIYNQVRDSLSLFFKVQRCGPTKPILHEPCHLSDATHIVGAKDSSIYDVTGGWHDAGDYIKFFTTTSFTTYLLLLAYETDPKKFSFDLDHNSVPDILEEARVGIDWLRRAAYKDSLFVCQVQDKEDHQQQWRLPEDDSLEFDRPGFVGISRAHIGMFTAVLSLASKIWKNRFYDDKFSRELKELAQKYFMQQLLVPAIDTTVGTDYHYKNFEDKIVLGTYEFSKANNDKIFGDDTLLDLYNELLLNKFKNQEQIYWWSWDDLSSLAAYRAAMFNNSFNDLLKDEIEFFVNDSNQLFEVQKFSAWGFTNLILGNALKILLYQKLTKDHSYSDQVYKTLNYLLGENPWGISFIYNIGENHTKNLHSQVAFFNSGYLPGALTAGPAPASLQKKYKLFNENSPLNRFNSPEFTYFDDLENYITNEPTISSNATALFVFGLLSDSE